MKKPIIVYRRNGNKITVHQAALYHAGETEEGWPIIDIQVGKELSWAELYAGHTAWVGEQVAKHREAVKRARAQRAAAKVGPVLNKGAV